jgi:hypothetical protein
MAGNVSASKARMTNMKRRTFSTAMNTRRFRSMMLGG